jgi:hypothetical protein
MTISETCKRRIERFFEVMAYSDPSGLYWIEQYTAQAAELQGRTPAEPAPAPARNQRRARVTPALAG